MHPKCTSGSERGHGKPTMVTPSQGARALLYLLQKLERYCQYLNSDRDYVLSQVLQMIFKKDKGFAQWLASQGARKEA